jgi:hypothetical protein
MGSSCGSLPPKFASLFALSLSIKAFSASFTKLDFSYKLVNAWAFASNSSSKTMVVLMADLRNDHRMMRFFVH